MQFKHLLSTLALAASFVNADIVARKDSGPDAESVLENDFRLTSVTTGKTLTSLATALVSADSSMHTRKDDMSAWSVFATAAPQSVVSSVVSDGWGYIETTAPPAWFTPLPKDVKSMFISEQSVLRSVETKVLDIKSTGTSNPAPRATAEMVMGALAAGAVGVVAML